MTFKNIIKQWFETEWGGSMILPDGWFGRPFDNQHILTSIREDSDALTLNLDKSLQLRFEGLQSVHSAKHKLIIGPFEKFCFEWTPYGGGKLNVQEYFEGEVKIVSSEASLNDMQDCAVQN